MDSGLGLRLTTKYSCLKAEEKELENVCRVRVRFSKMNLMNIVWHGICLNYLEDGRESFGRHYSGIDYQTMADAR